MCSVLKTPEILCKSKLLPRIINNIFCVCVTQRQREGRERERLEPHVYALRYFKLPCHFQTISVF